MQSGAAKQTQAITGSYYPCFANDATMLLSGWCYAVKQSEPYEENQQYTYDVNELPTLVDSTQVAEDLPTAIGADTNTGGVSMIGGIVCWVGVLIAVAVILACLFSTRGKAKSSAGRFESGNKLNKSSYGGKYR